MRTIWAIVLWSRSDTFDTEKPWQRPSPGPITCRGAEFVGVDLRGARFVEADLSGVVMRAVEVREADIEAPWLSNGGSFLRVNGVDVIPLVEAQLNLDMSVFTTVTWNPEYQEETVSCLHVILEEEWEHHRYAVRDLDAIEGEPAAAR